MLTQNKKVNLEKQATTLDPGRMRSPFALTLTLNPPGSAAACSSARIRTHASMHTRVRNEQLRGRVHGVSVHACMSWRAHVRQRQAGRIRCTDRLIHPGTCIT
jgi:hypothetical protein